MGWNGAPATIVLPSIATEAPRNSPLPASDAVSVATCVASAHPEAGLTKTYAAPRLLPPASACSAPTTAVSPEIATERPNRSSAWPADAVSLADWNTGSIVSG